MADKFLEHLKRVREASAPAGVGTKDPATMTDEERDAEIRRLEDEVRRAKIREVEAARGGLGETPARRPHLFGGRRPPWT